MDTPRLREMAALKQGEAARRLYGAPQEKTGHQEVLWENAVMRPPVIAWL